MATVSTVLRPGPLFYYNAPWRLPNWYFDDPGTYPSGEPWADDSDATSHLLSGYTDSSTGSPQYHSTTASGDFGTLPAAVTSVELAVRWSYVSTDVSTADSFAVYLSDAVEEYILDGTASISNPVITTEPQWYVETFAQDYYSSIPVRATAFMPSATPETLQDLFRVHEVKLTVYYEGPAAPYVPPALAHPSLRMLQRGGSGGMSGIPRMVGNPTVRGSLRRGPGSVL